MSVHTEWAMARNITVTLAHRGQHIEGAEIPVEEPHALVLDGGGGGLFVIEGTGEHLAALLVDMARVVLASSR